MIALTSNYLSLTPDQKLTRIIDLQIMRDEVKKIRKIKKVKKVKVKKKITFFSAEVEKLFNSMTPEMQEAMNKES